MYFYIPLILWIIIDLGTKQLALAFLSDRIKIIWDLFFLKYAENSGIAFSITIPYIKIITVWLIIGIFCYYFYYEKKQNSKLLDLAFWFIWAWAIGNGLERILNGYVIDFIGVKNFAIFNMADIFINIGVILYLYYLYQETPKALDKVTIREEYWS